jgi:hypothetical protein
MRVARKRRPAAKPSDGLEPLVAFGGGQDEPDDVTIGGYRLVRSPDGRLVGPPPSAGRGK